MLQINTDKIAVTLKAIDMVVYPVHVVLLTFTNDYRRYFIDHGNTFIVVLLASKFVYEQNSNEFSLHLILLCCWQTSCSKLETRMEDIRKKPTLQKGMQKILFSWSASVDNGFDVSLRGKRLKYHAALILYCCNIAKKEDMLRANNGTQAHSCDRCLASEKGQCCRK